MADLLSILGLALKAPGPQVQPFDTYESRCPGLQTMIDAVPGWNTAFPPEMDLRAGAYHFFDDGRIAWLLERCGHLGGKQVLEIGPLDGAHTTMLHQAGAQILAIEAKRQSFLRCLVTRQIMNLDKATFMVGDAVQWLEREPARFDLIVACGVLYHMIDPLRFLQSVAAHTDRLYIWTHFVEESRIPPDHEAAHGFASTRETRMFAGEAMTLYRRAYAGVHRKAEFCGGIYDEPRWMARQSILDCLRLLGFTSAETAHEDEVRPHEPSFSIYATR
jgi:hypothetical protein